MKSVLVVDASPIFLEFLKDKLNSEKIEVYSVQDKMDSIPKMISLLPDLVIVDISDDEPPDFFLDFLRKVKADPNASRLPMIATGPQVEKEEIALYAKFGVSKYFIKPIKFDFFFNAVGHYLKQPFAMDTTPCVLEIHLNGNVVLIEIAKGLNREKLFLLRYKLSELIENSNLEYPKVIVMMTDLDLTFVDGLNLELLFNNILSNSQVKANNVYVLSLSSFVKEFISGHKEYNGIQVATDISQVLNSVVETSSSSRISDVITDKILSNENEPKESSSLEMRFSQDTQSVEEEIKKQDAIDKRVAVVDDDSVILDLIAGAFRNAKIACDTYTNANDFLEKVGKIKYSLIILDILMPGISGFETLKKLREMPSSPPIFVYSQALKREMVIQALQLGAKQYLVKPQKPEAIVKKAMDVFNESGNKK